MNRRFGFPWIWGLATAAIATIVGVIAYHAGETSTVVASTPGNQGVYHGYYGFGFFPFFGLFWILLLGFLFFRFIFWRPWGRGPWGGPHYHDHDHTHDAAPTTPPATKPDEPTIA